MALASPILQPYAFGARILDAFLVIARAAVSALNNLIQLERKQGFPGVATLAQETASDTEL